jgi:hypothetical protein
VNSDPSSTNTCSTLFADTVDGKLTGTLPGIGTSPVVRGTPQARGALLGHLGAGQTPWIGSGGQPSHF